MIKDFTIPKYKQFINEAKKYAIVKVAVIGRDRNILKHQQQRVRRGKYTTPTFLKHIKFIKDPFYISQELFFLYGTDYLKSVSKQLDFPISTGTYIKNLSKHEANKKYIKKANRGKFDKYQFKINY